MSIQISEFLESENLHGNPREQNGPFLAPSRGIPLHFLRKFIWIFFSSAICIEIMV